MKRKTHKPTLFEGLQKEGAKRHGDAWWYGNKAAVHAAMGYMDVSDPASKEMLSLVVLRVLDAVLWEPKPKRKS